MNYTTNAVPPPSDQKILRFQKNYRVTLPEDYIKFLQKNNGGAAIYRCFSTKNNTKVIHRFFAMMDDPNSDRFMGQYDVGVTWSQVFDRMAEDPDQIGTKLVPVVALEFGDMVCLDFREKPNAPEVVVWDHEQSKELKPVTEKIADSFTEFLGKLKPLEPYERPVAA